VNLQELQEQKRNLGQRFAEREVHDTQVDDTIYFLHKIAKSLADIDFTLSQAFKKEKALHSRNL